MSSSTHTALFSQVAAILNKDLPPIEQLSQSLPSIVNALKHPEAIDDHLLLLENLLTLMSELGQNDAPAENQRISMQLQKVAIDFLYKDLPHPPSSYLALSPPSKPKSAQAPTSNGSSYDPAGTPTSYQEGVYVPYAYRSADGSNYNPLIPSLGQAGMPYARSVDGALQTNLKNLPDPALVFDMLLKRPTKKEEDGEDQDGFTPHPGGVSSLFFALADLIIHTIFNTNQSNPTVNDASSYLDLSVLYGSSEKEVQSVRRKDSEGRPDGTGRLYEDVFADGRLLLMTPATCALLVVFSRNHNFVAQRILEINERGIYKDPAVLRAQAFASGLSDKDKAQALRVLQAQDDEIFHRARLVNTGFFMQVILGDYVGAILGLARDGSNWRLNPLMELRRLSHEFAPRGEGNVVSIEFNLLYRWHATLSKQDKEWTENMFQKALDDAGVNASFDKLTPREFFQAAGKALGPEQQKDVRTWTFNNLKRDSTGRFSDADIAKLLQDSTSYRAGAFKARAIPEVLKVIEVLGITQARGWGACSLNEFRKFIGLEPYSSFKDWNNDDSVANSAELLYKHIDNLELHVGMQAEQPKRPGPGAGLCPGYTISRAILADAVCLTRGDRFLTVDFTPFNLTTWGYADCQYPTAADGSYGGMLTKLLFRHFPAYYPARSAYAHFPFLEPSYMEKTMRERDATNKTNIADQYIWSRPKPPVGVQSREISVVDSYVGASEILNSPQVWKSDYDERLGIVVAGLKNPTLPDTMTVEKVLNAFSDTWPAFFRQTTDRLLTTRSVSRAGSSLKFVDIVKDVINVLPVQWICENLAGISIESSYVDNLNDVCQYVFLDWEPVDDWELRESSVGFFRKFHELVKRHLEKESHFISNTISHIRGPPHGKRTAFLETLHEKHGSMSADQLAAALFCLVVPTAAHWSQSVAHVVNYYLDHNRKGERSEIVSLVNAGKTHEAMGLIRAALDADPPVSAVQRTALKATVVPGMSAKEVVAGENVLVSIVEANQNIPTGKQGIIGVGEYGLLSSHFFETITPGVVGKILGLSNLQRGPGESGEFTRFTQNLRGAPEQVYVDARGGLTPFPTSLIVSYTEDQGAY